jgi:hypothetical protein
MSKAWTLPVGATTRCAAFREEAHEATVVALATLAEVTDCASLLAMLARD